VDWFYLILCFVCDPTSPPVHRGLGGRQTIADPRHLDPGISTAAGVGGWSSAAGAGEEERAHGVKVKIPPGHVESCMGRQLVLFGGEWTSML
jgi:hypothetical protein